MKTNLVLLGLVVLVFSGCAKSNSAGDGAAATDTSHSLSLLNSLANSGSDSNKIGIHFDSLEQVNILAVAVEPEPLIAYDCPANADCTPPPLSQPLQRASISGTGQISAPQFPQPLTESLDLWVTFDPTLPNGETCLAMAQDALIHGLQFDIQAMVTLIPFTGWGVAEPGSAASGMAGGTTSNSVTATTSASVPSTTLTDLATDPSAVSTLISTGTSVNQGVLPAPTFYWLGAGAILTSIQSCSEGGPAIVTSPPPPIPVPTPILPPIPTPAPAPVPVPLTIFAPGTAAN